MFARKHIGFEDLLLLPNPVFFRSEDAYFSFKNANLL